MNEPNEPFDSFDAFLTGALTVFVWILAGVGAVGILVLLGYFS